MRQANPHRSSPSRRLAVTTSVAALLATPTVAHAGPATQLADIDTKADASPSSSPVPLAMVAAPSPMQTSGAGLRSSAVPLGMGFLYFSAADARNGRELWKSDSTAAGTVMVKDIVPGPTDAKFGIGANCYGVLVFVVDDGIHGAELWRSDGTAAGTFLLKDISPGVADTKFSNMRMFESHLHFDVQPHGAKTAEPWITDGTVAGTARDTGAKPAHVNVPPAAPSGYAADHMLEWEAVPGGYQLWTTDGTAAGTRQLSVTAPGIVPAPGIFETSERVYAWVSVTAQGANSIYVLDRKTRQFLPPPAAMMTGGNDGEMVQVKGGKVVFDGGTTTGETMNDVPLWITDGTPQATFRIATQRSQLYAGFRHNLMEIDGKALYVLSGYDDALLVTDGSPNSVQLTSRENGSLINFGPLMKVGNVAEFIVTNGNYKSTLWQSDGTGKGTHPVVGLPNGHWGTTWMLPGNLGMFADANDGVSGQEAGSCRASTAPW